MPRNIYDLSHFEFSAGQVGRLQTLACIPIIAGDSIELNMQGIWRQSALRRNLTVDAHVDNFAFFVPHRHIYGDDWINFIKQGTDETVTFSTINLGAEEIDYIASGSATGVLPLWRFAGYNRIWNRYFRAPTDVTAELSDTDFGTGDSNRKQFGQLCGRIKTPWTSGINATVDASDREASTAGNVLDILDLERVRARYRTEQQRDWFNQRYTDLLEDVFGGFANADADERPTLIKRQHHMLSGYDVDGTDAAALGTYSGKSVGTCGLSFPRRFFPEHGALWIMTLMRYPTIHEEEVHYLDKKSQPTYLEIAADPQLWEAEPPHEIQVQDFFKGTDSSSLGTVPYGQWYRYHPSHVHRLYDALDGFTFIASIPGNQDQARYVRNNDYNNVYQTTQLGDWQVQARIGVTAHRAVPTVLESIFAGATNS